MKNNLALFRTKAELTQEKLSELSGISRVYISEIETGKRSTLTNVTMQKLADALKVSVTDIFFVNDIVVNKQQ